MAVKIKAIILPQFIRDDYILTIFFIEFWQDYSKKTIFQAA